MTIDMTMSLAESRGSTRIRCDSRVLLQVAGRIHQGRLEDVSLRGALVILDAPVQDPVGRACRLEVQDQRAAIGVVLNGIVVHENALGTRLGVKVVAVGDAASSALWQLVSAGGATMDAMDRDWSALLDDGAGAEATGCSA